VNQKVSRIRELLKDATPVRAPTAPSLDENRLRAFEYYEFNVSLPVVQQSPRARALREIARISTWYGLGAEVTRYLDRESVEVAGELSDDAVDALLSRLRQLEDAIQSGCDPADSPPAR
jgi:hypothetical protein